MFIFIGIRRRHLWKPLSLRMWAQAKMHTEVCGFAGARRGVCVCVWQTERERDKDSEAVGMGIFPALSTWECPVSWNENCGPSEGHSSLICRDKSISFFNSVRVHCAMGVSAHEGVCMYLPRTCIYVLCWQLAVQQVARLQGSLPRHAHSCAPPPPTWPECCNRKAAAIYCIVCVNAVARSFKQQEEFVSIMIMKSWFWLLTYCTNSRVTNVTNGRKRKVASSEFNQVKENENISKIYTFHFRKSFLKLERKHLTITASQKWDSDALACFIS